MSQHPHFDSRNSHSQPDADKNQQLRLPNRDTMDFLMRGDQASASSVASGNAPKPGLSVDAPVFKPRLNPSQGGGSMPVGNMQQMPPPSYATPPPFHHPTPRQGPPPQGPPPMASDPQYNPRMQMGGGGTGGGGGMNQDPVDRPSVQTELLITQFANCLCTLTLHPANVQEFLNPLCSKLRHTHSEDLLNVIIAMLYEQCVYEINFHYTGARVVHHLSQELKDHPIYGKFKAAFLKKCQPDYNRREELINMGERGLQTVCGLTMFMGDLFLNVPADVSGHTQRFDFLPLVLTDLLLTLLSQPSDTSIKTTCQLLKMAGGPVEDTMSQKPEMPKFQQVFNCLQGLLTTPQVSQNMKALIQSVLNLRQNNWNRTDSSVSRDTSQDKLGPPQDFTQSEPVFFDQFGKRISRQEAGFQEEEEDDYYEGYELTEEEEQEFLLWQEEEKKMGITPAQQGQGDMGNPQLPYGFDSSYQQWSTGDSNYSSSYYQGNYDDFNQYQQAYNGGGLGDDEGLSEEMEKAFEEFLSSQPGGGH